MCESFCVLGMQYVSIFKCLDAPWTFKLNFLLKRFKFRLKQSLGAAPIYSWMVELLLEKSRKFLL